MRCYGHPCVTYIIVVVVIIIIVISLSLRLTRTSLTLHATARSHDSSATRRHTGALSKTFNNNKVIIIRIIRVIIVIGLLVYWQVDKMQDELKRYDDHNHSFAMNVTRVIHILLT